MSLFRLSWFTNVRNHWQTVHNLLPGCTHGVAHRLVAEVLDAMDLRDPARSVWLRGCSVFATISLISICGKLPWSRSSHGYCIKRVLQSGGLHYQAMATGLHWYERDRAFGGARENITVFYQ